MVKLKQAVVVEGRYDINTLRQIIDAPIFETRGFGIMTDAEQLALLRAAARKRGLVILTDSDSAGFVIRNYLKNALSGENILHAYIPDVYGKEKRKSSPEKRASSAWRVCAPKSSSRRSATPARSSTAKAAPPPPSRSQKPTFTPSASAADRTAPSAAEPSNVKWDCPSI